MISPAWLEPSGPGWSGSRWTMKSSASPPSVKRARLPNTSSPTKKTWAQAAIHLVRARGRPDPGERDGLEPRTRWWRRQGSELASRPIRRTNAPDNSLSRVSPKTRTIAPKTWTPGAESSCIIKERSCPEQTKKYALALLAKTCRCPGRERKKATILEDTAAELG